MKYLKEYEINNFDLQIGDYVVCDEQTTNNISLKMFISNNIGKYIRNVTGLQYSENNKFPYLIKYENFPDEFSDYFSTSNSIIMSENEIILV